MTRIDDAELAEAGAQCSERSTFNVQPQGFDDLACAPSSVQYSN
jgi:hypothetical protein